jgi:hypothetical protein
MKTLLIVLAATAARFLVACGGDTPTCEACLAQQGHGVDPGGCYPYCEAPPDTDGDGVEDAEDECPDTPESVNGYQDGDGCPDVRPYPVPLSAEIAGTWTGATHLAVNGGTYVKNQAVQLSVSADRLSGVISGFCPDGSGAGSLAAYTTAPDASWVGIYSCPPGQWGVCDDGLAILANMVVLTVVARPTPNGVSVETTGAVTLTDNNNLTQRHCETTGAFSSTFTGTR